MNYFLDEALEEAFPDIDFQALPEEKLQQGYKSLTEHIELFDEHMSYGTPRGDYAPTPPRDSDEVVHLKRQIAKLEDEIRVYQNSVKKRRGVDQVWTEHGEVMYRRGLL